MSVREMKISEYQLALLNALGISVNDDKKRPVSLTIRVSPQEWPSVTVKYDLGLKDDMIQIIMQRYKLVPIELEVDELENPCVTALENLLRVLPDTLDIKDDKLYAAVRVAQDAMSIIERRKAEKDDEA